MTVSSGVTSVTKEVFGWSRRQYQADELARLNGIPESYIPLNSVQHAYTSATLQREYGGNTARTLGNALELVTAAKNIGSRADPNKLAEVRADTFKDLWNNAIGREIGEYARQRNLSQGDLESLITQAYNRGDLIRDLYCSFIVFNNGQTPFAPPSPAAGA